MKSFSKVIKRVFFYLFILLGFIAGLLALLAVIILGQIPSSKEIRGCMTTTMNHVRLCPEENDYVKMNSISGYLRKAVVITEDSAFFQHQGFDFQEIERSIEKNLKDKKFSRGGSTITQQLAKNLFLSKEKTLSRKFFEAIITVKIERTLSKNEILERYLNVVQFGKDIYGVKKAAQFYFKKKPSELDAVESAFLTFLLPNPEGYSKSFFKKSLTPFAKTRIQTILQKLYVFQRISEDDYQHARARVDYFLGGQQPPAVEINPDEIIEALPDDVEEDSELFIQEDDPVSPESSEE